MRIIWSFTQVGDTVFDAFAGTGITLVTAYQLQKKGRGEEIYLRNVTFIKRRLGELRDAHTIGKYYRHYKFTQDLEKMWDFDDSLNKKLLTQLV